MNPFARRTFLRRMVGLSAGAWATRLWVPEAREAWARTRDTAVRVTGTTLERSIQPVGDGPYFHLDFRPGFPIQVRTELAQAAAGRELRREPLATVLHLTDFQLVDGQSPARVEFLDRHSDEPTADVPFGAAFRPQEALVAHVVDALIQQANDIDRGPVTGRAFDVTVCTGDNIDNVQANELRWYLTLMDGGRIAANSGDPDTFEGVQSFDDPAFYDPHYYHPEDVADPRSDVYKRSYGFPTLPGLLQAAITPFTAVGVSTPWYSLYGNHDALVQGNAPENGAFERAATGGTKVLGPPPGYGPADFYRGLAEQDPGAVTAFQLAPARPVTADDERHFVSAEEYIRAHLASPARPGPVGHGYTEDNLEGPTLYFTFDVSEEIFGIALDTNSPQTSEGSIDGEQLAWLEARLIEVHSRHFDSAGTEVSTGNADRLVAIFTHHRAASMMAMPGRDRDGNPEQRFGGGELEELLHRFPNVIAWINGHSHENRIFARPDPAGLTAGYWDITTSAQVDPPQQARIIEFADNRDGTLSIFTTIVDHAGPPRYDEVETEAVLTLASIGRELAFNDYEGDALARLGAPTDINTELIIPTPFDLRGGGTSTGSAGTASTSGTATSGTGTSTGTGTASGTGSSGAATGAGTLGPTGGDTPSTGSGAAGVVAGTAAIAAAAALRRRSTDERASYSD